MPNDAAAPARRAPLAIGATVAVLSLLLLPGIACAQQYEVTIDASSRADTNIFRVPDSVAKTYSHDGADLLNFISVEGRGSDQRGDLSAELTGSLGQSLYAYNTSLNRFQYSASSQVDYAAPRTGVTLYAEHRLRPVAFEDSRSVRNVLQSFTRLSTDASRNVLGDIRAVGRVNYTRSRAADDTLQRNDSARLGYGGGLGYFSPTGNSITLEVARLQTTTFIDSQVRVGDGFLRYRPEFVENSIVSRLLYAPTALTKITSSVGYTWHNDRSALNADFKGVTADAAIEWSPLPTVFVTPAFRRAFSTENGLFSNGVEVTSYGVSATAVVLGRLNVGSRLNHVRRNFRYDLQANDPLNLARVENTTRFNANVSLVTGSRFIVQVAYDHIGRSATLGQYSFGSDAVTLSLSRKLSY
ncbi:MAG: hypothetical protein PGN12_13525 [Sphingomonas phyllosphaerae]